MSASMIERLDVSQPFPELKSFLFEEKNEEIQKLRERVSAVTGSFPDHFRGLVQGICHSEFKITVNDASILRSIHSVVMQLSTKSEKIFWETIASQLDLLIQSKAALPVLHLPLEILFEIASYLSLPDLSRFIQSTCIKENTSSSVATQQARRSFLKYKTKLRLQYSSLVKDMIAMSPSLILRAQSEQTALKARIFQNLSKEWRGNQNMHALTKLFYILHHPNNQELRLHYLKGLKDSKLFNAFLESNAIADNPSLCVDIIPSTLNLKNGSALLYPLVPFNSQYLNYWKQLIQAHLHVQFLAIRTKLNDDFTAYRRKEFLFEVINQLQNVTSLTLTYENLAQSLPVFYPSQLGVYREFIQKFSALQTLQIRCHEVQKQAINSRTDIHRRIAAVSSNIQKLLHAQLPIQYLILNIDCFANTAVTAIERYHQINGSIYPSYYLNLFLPVIEQALQLENLIELQLIIPKPSTPKTIEMITNRLELNFRPFLERMKMDRIDDKLAFIFQKANKS